MSPNPTMKSIELNPKQPEFVLGTSDYKKKVFMQNGIAHFYQFTAEAQTIAVIPDACVDILFEKSQSQLTAIVAGSRFVRGIVPTTLGHEYFGIRFLPGFNPIKHALKLSEIMNNEYSYFDVLPSRTEKNKLFEDIYKATTFEMRIQRFLDVYLPTSCSLSPHQQNPLTELLHHHILNASGDLKLKDLCTLSGYSERYLNQRIHEEFGLNPKSLIQFVRFQKSVNTLIQDISRPSAMDVALNSGYYDQSHYIKDFKKYTDQTPTHYLNNLICHAYRNKLHIVK